MGSACPEISNGGESDPRDIMTARTRLVAVGAWAVAIGLVGVAAYRYVTVVRPRDGRIIARPRDVARTPAASRPALWVLSIGVSKYQDENISLRYADADAVAVAAALERQSGGLLYSEVRSLVLTNAEVTRKSILEEGSRFLNQAGPDDVAVIFLAGHGVQDHTTHKYYFLPHAANSDNLLADGVRMSDFDDMVGTLQRNVRRVVVMLDTCHSGALRVTSRAVAAGDDLAQRLSTGEGMFLLAASKAGEESLAPEALEHGAFTRALLDGLQGGADFDGDGLISVSDLFAYVARQVPRLTEGRQHPYHEIKGTELILASIPRGGEASYPVERVRPTAKQAAEPAPTPAPNTIGVLEFRNLQVKPEYDWVGEALRTALYTELSKVRALRVFSPQLIDPTWRQSGLNELETARRVGISRVVTGSYHILGNRIRVDASILNAVNGESEGADSASGALDSEEFFALQKQLVTSILSRLPVPVLAAEDKAIQEKTNTSVSALRLLLEAEGVAEDPATVERPTSPPAATSDSTKPSASLWKGASHWAYRLYGTAYAAELPGDLDAEVRQFLTEYRLAHEEKDPDRLASLHVSFSERQRKAVDEYLRNANDLRVELADVEIEPHDGDVAISYTRRDSFVDRESGKPTRVEVRLTKILVRGDGGWKIAPTR
jgi:TolB-like protein